MFFCVYVVPRASVPMSVVSIHFESDLTNFGIHQTRLGLLVAYAASAGYKSRRTCPGSINTFRGSTSIESPFGLLLEAVTGGCSVRSQDAECERTEHVGYSSCAACRIVVCGDIIFPHQT
jgi:hypothetical protein